MEVVKRHYFMQEALLYITFDSAPKSHKESHRSTKRMKYRLIRFLWWCKCQI